MDRPAPHPLAATAAVDRSSAGGMAGVEAFGGGASSVGACSGGASVLELLRPGSFVRLHNHPQDLPPFLLIRCRGGRCWVRQQAWGQLVQWEVAHRQLTTAA